MEDILIPKVSAVFKPAVNFLGLNPVLEIDSDDILVVSGLDLLAYMRKGLDSYCRIIRNTEKTPGNDQAR